MIITFPHLGNAYISVKALLDDLGVQYVIPPFNNKKGLEMGTKHAPEMACLPLKINIGNYIQACPQGADTILMAGGCGPCRFGYYCEMHREIMSDIGYDMDIITLEMINGNASELLANIKKLAGGTSPLKAVMATVRMVKIAKQVDEIEMLTFKIRPREKIKGSTDAIYKDFRNRVFNVRGCRNILDLITKTREKLIRIETDNSFQPLKIGIVGEIYTTIEHTCSFDLQNKLGNMGVEVDRQVTVSGWIIEHILKKAFHLPRNMEYAKAAKPYIRTMIGGHAQETIVHTILYSQKGYDGVIQIFPLTCMPEIVAESILPKVEEDFGIPVLTVIIDELTGEAGYMTCVEAFIDLLKKRREQKV